MAKLNQIHDVSIGHNLRKFREQIGLSQEQVTVKMELLGRPMSRSNYAMIEAGTRNIFISDLIALKTIFRVDFNSLFDGVEIQVRKKAEEED